MSAPPSEPALSLEDESAEAHTGMDYAPSETSHAVTATELRVCNELAEVAAEGINLDSYGDCESFEAAVLFYVGALSDKSFMPSWNFFQKVAGYRTDLYADAPSNGGRVRPEL